MPLGPSQAKAASSNLGDYHGFVASEEAMMLLTGGEVASPEYAGEGTPAYRSQQNHLHLPHGRLGIYLCHLTYYLLPS